MKDNISKYESKFDHVIIGSSPLMLILALTLINQKKKICIIERDKLIGGAWKTYKNKELGTLETAAHLVEPYRNVYKILEKYSGERFILPELQPIKVLSKFIVLKFQLINK